MGAHGGTGAHTRYVNDSIGCTAGLLFLETHMDNQFAKKPEGLRQFREHRWKALGGENPDLSGLFLFRHYFESYTE